MRAVAKAHTVPAFVARFAKFFCLLFFSHYISVCGMYYEEKIFSKTVNLKRIPLPMCFPIFPSSRDSGMQTRDRCPVDSFSALSV